MTVELGKVGIWDGRLRGGEPGTAGELAAAIEQLGYGALWIPGGAGGRVLEKCEEALQATTRLVLATGILNVWRHEPAEVAATTARLQSGSGGRFLLGLGISHERLIGDDYVRPVETMTRYLDDLDAAGQPAGERVIAALRPRMLALAASRSAGTHPYFVPPEHSAAARAVVGEGALVAPEQTVVLETDPARAREIARQFCSTYLGLPNYTNNLRALGYADDELEPPGSDRVIDAIVAWGDASAIATRVRAHLDAGADHVCIQVVGGDPAVAPLDAWRELAGALL